MSQAQNKAAVIIDDDEDYRRLMCELLEQHGWKTLGARDGEEGIRLVKESKPAVVVCDLLMPRCNGFQVCRELRRDPSLRSVKIVVSSGRQFAADLQAAHEAGADEYLAKPAQADQVLLLLARLTDPTPTAEGMASPKPVAPQETPRLRFWGVRGSIPTPGPTTIEYGGNTSCVEVRADGQFIILDAGSGLRMLGRHLLEEFGQQPLALTLLLTHTHWDHIQGLPFFSPVYKPQNQLRILGYEGARHGLVTVLNSQMESPFFPIGLGEVPANVRIEEVKDLSFNLGPVRVETCFANHPGICVGYRIFTSAGSIAFFPDNEPYGGSARLVAGDSQEAAADFARSENQKMIEFLRGTDVLVMDTQYDLDEYCRHVGWGHGCVDDVVTLAIQAEVKRLFLFHHDPDHDDAKISQMVAHARELVSSRQAVLQVDAAKEGLVVELGTVPACSNS
jgi:phosphoribosyl 1,2-cyclic phosphodiesterase/ActR/RegA family two-component response regulator